jgi:hypothetical protein
MNHEATIAARVFPHDCSWMCAPVCGDG